MTEQGESDGLAAKLLTLTAATAAPAAVAVVAFLPATLEARALAEAAAATEAGAMIGDGGLTILKYRLRRSSIGLHPPSP